MTDLDALSMIAAPVAGLSSAALASRAVLKYEIDNGIVTLDTLGVRKPEASNDAVTEGLEKEKTCLNFLLPWANSVLTCTMVIGYPMVIIPVFRSGIVGDYFRCAIVCLIHPIFAEVVATIQRQGKGFRYMNLQSMDRYGHLPLSLLMQPGLIECTFAFYRRFMIGMMVDPGASIVAVVLTGLEEAIMRCTMVPRDKTYRFLVNEAELGGEADKRQKQVWACSSANSMIFEIVAIISTHLTYMLFRPNRFVINLGYGATALDREMTTVSITLTALFVELAFECAIDVLAVTVEHDQGVDLDDFWKIWHRNPWAYYPDHIIICALAIFLSLWACTCSPTPIFCPSIDPCSCQGGGFSIYESQCAVLGSNGSIVGKNNISYGFNDGNSSIALTNIKEMHREEFQTFVSFVSQNSTLLVVIGFTTLCIILTFVSAHLLQASEKNREISKRNLWLEKENTRIRREIAVEQLTPNQIQLVKSGKVQFEAKLKKKYEINWRNILFERLLGSGSFGDCYLGSFFERQVAVKKMRSGMVDEAGFEAFVNEVELLIMVEHPNIVSFLGYSLRPALLIVMSFCNGASMKELYLSDILVPKEVTIRLLRHVALGMCCLHQEHNMPIIHRDIKADNILLHCEG